MPNNNYINGRNREYRSVKLLEAAGYTCIRSAGSHGVWDVVGFSPTSMILVQVKYETKPSPAEMEGMRACQVPSNAVKLVHLYKKGTHAPTVIAVE